jgi:broad-specificity NMP kinase
MPCVLVTGMSGTGKSTVLGELARRGLRTVDTDYGGWSYETPISGGSGVEQLWREDLMARLLQGAAGGPLIVSGTVSNQGRFYDRFDAVVLLSAPIEVLLGRLAGRLNNPFGKDPEQLRRILSDIETVEPLLRAGCSLEIDTTASVGDIADQIEGLAVAS